MPLGAAAKPAPGRVRGRHYLEPMVIVNKTAGVVFFGVSGGAPEIRLEPGKNDVSEAWLDKLTADQGKALERLFSRGVLGFEDPTASLPEPAPEAPKTSDLPLDVLLPAIALETDVAGLDSLFKTDARPEVADAIAKRMIELDKLAPRELAALQPVPAVTMTESAPEAAAE